MSRIQLAIEAAGAAVPTGKTLAWIAGSIVVAWFGGVGWTLKTGELQEHISLIPAIEADVSENRSRIMVIEDGLDASQQSSEQILCYVRMIANGEDPGTELDPRCPPG